MHAMAATDRRPDPLSSTTSSHGLRSLMRGILGFRLLHQVGFAAGFPASFLERGLTDATFQLSFIYASEWHAGSRDRLLWGLCSLRAVAVAVTATSRLCHGSTWKTSPSPKRPDEDRPCRWSAKRPGRAARGHGQRRRGNKDRCLSREGESGGVPAKERAVVTGRVPVQARPAICQGRQRSPTISSRRTSAPPLT
jgi:hypothetical protein